VRAVEGKKEEQDGFLAGQRSIEIGGEADEIIELTVLILLLLN
jgi:hypothetical protein